MRFTDTENKRAIRKYDKDILKEYAKEKNKKLSYLGLPGATMLDIIDWKEYLSRYTSIEIDKNEYRNLILTALSTGLSKGLKAVMGDIDEILSKNERVIFPYDLFNLDYSGGALYKNRHGGSKRINAWQSLFRRQSKQKEDFLLLITLNSREKDEGELNFILDEIKNNLTNKEFSDKIDEIKRGRKQPKFMIYVPYLVQKLAAENHYQLKYNGPIFYKGSSNISMTHFVFILTYQKGVATPMPFSCSLNEIIDSKIKVCEKGEIIDQSLG